MTMCQSPQCHEFNGNVTEFTDLGLYEEGGGVILLAFSPMQNCLDYWNCKKNSLRDHAILVCVYQISCGI